MGVRKIISDRKDSMGKHSVVWGSAGLRKTRVTGVHKRRG